MSKVKLIAKLSDKIEYDSDYSYIGVDKGALLCMKYNIPMVCALGDFDSILQEEYEQLLTYCPILKLPEAKNESDGEYAITYAIQQGYDEIEIVGATGGRIDHFMAIYLKMISCDKKIMIKDDKNRIYTLLSGTHSVKKTSKYISFFACEEGNITLDGFKYPLNDRKINPLDIYMISNEIEKKEGIITNTGKIVVIESDD